MNRWPETSSTIAVPIATTQGLRTSTGSTPAPKRIRLVFDANAVNTANASPRRPSATQTAPKLRVSASRETLGRCVDRSSKPCRSRSDDCYVINSIGFERRHQPDTTCQRDFARIAQDFAARAEHDRQFARRDVEALDQGLGAR